MLYIVSTLVLTMLYTTEIDTGLNPRCQSFITLKVAIQVLDSCHLRRGRSELGALGGGAPQTAAGGLRPPAPPAVQLTLGKRRGQTVPTWIEVMFYTKQVKCFTQRMIDEIKQRFRLLVKARDRRENNSPALSHRRH